MCAIRQAKRPLVTGRSNIAALVPMSVDEVVNVTLLKSSPVSSQSDGDRGQSDRCDRMRIQDDPGADVDVIP